MPSPESLARSVETLRSNNRSLAEEVDNLKISKRKETKEARSSGMATGITAIVAGGLVSIGFDRLWLMLEEKWPTVKGWRMAAKLALGLAIALVGFMSGNVPLMVGAITTLVLTAYDRIQGATGTALVSSVSGTTDNNGLLIDNLTDEDIEALSASMAGLEPVDYQDFAGELEMGFLSPLAVKLLLEVAKAGIPITKEVIDRVREHRDTRTAVTRPNTRARMAARRERRPTLPPPATSMPPVYRQEFNKNMQPDTPTQPRQQFNQNMQAARQESNDLVLPRKEELDTLLQNMLSRQSVPEGAPVREFVEDGLNLMLAQAEKGKQ